jgi:TetR/AcrR family fatty acid metabolism transcriptional regulator
MIFGALDEMATNWVLTQRRYDLASQADLVIDLFVRGLGTPPIARERARARPQDTA